MAGAAAPAVRRERRAERAAPGHTPAGRRRALTVAPAPRRVSGPSRRPAPLSNSRVARKVGSLVLARVWIGLVAFALIGIVTLQLVVLKLNTSIGHALAQASVLQRENAALSIENSESVASNQVESRAEGIGMQLIPAGSLRFLSVGPGAEVTRAATALSSTQRSAAASGEAGTAAAGSESSGGESSTALAAGGSAGASAVESSTASGESAAGSPAGAPAGSTAATPSGGASTAASAPATATAPTGSSAEAAPAGGTQADARG